MSENNKLHTLLGGLNRPQPATDGSNVAQKSSGPMTFEEWSEQEIPGDSAESDIARVFAHAGWKACEKVAEAEKAELLGMLEMFVQGRFEFREKARALIAKHGGVE